MSDLISRSALLEETKSLTVTVMGLRAGKGILHEYAKQYKDTLLRIIEEQPTIEAVPVVHGEWIFKNDGAYRQRRAYCSVCGKRSGIGGIESNQRKPFCPNCGADMRKGGA